MLLLTTIALYLIACTTLEDAFDNWCYLLYIGLVITPIILFLYTGLEEPKNWQKMESNLYILAWLFQ